MLLLWLLGAGRRASLRSHHCVELLAAHCVLDRHTRIQTRMRFFPVPRARARFWRMRSSLGCVVSPSPCASQWAFTRWHCGLANSSRRRATGSLRHRNPRSDLLKPLRKLRVSNCARRARTALCTQHPKKVWRPTSSTSPCRMTRTSNNRHRSSHRSARPQIFCSSP